MKKLNDLSLGLICVLYLCMSVCAHGAPAAKRAVKIQVTKYGELVYSNEGKVESIDQSLTDIVQAQGYAAMRANPLTILLSLITHNAYPSTELNSDALNEFFARANSLDLTDIATAVVPAVTRRINMALGTLDDLASSPWNVYEMRASLIWHDIPGKSRKFAASLDPLVATLFENWLKGAKRAANEIKSSIYAEFPLLAEARVIEEFQRRTVVDIVAQITAMGLLYDAGAIAGAHGLTASWLPISSNNRAAPVKGAAVSLSPEEVLAAPVKAIGASNAAAMVVRVVGEKSPVSVAFGEPHQQTSSQTESTNNIMLLTSSTGKITTFQGFQFPAIAGAFGIQFSKFYSIAGTAAPAHASASFFVEILDQLGLTYRDPVDNKAKKFVMRSIIVPNSLGQMVTVQVRSIGSDDNYAGDVYLMKRQTGTNTPYAIAMRSNKNANTANNFWNLTISGLKRDAEKFKSTVKDGLNLWAAAMSFADADKNQHTAQFNFQGRPDRVKSLNGAVLNPLTVNPAVFPRVGQLETPGCFDPNISPLGTSVVAANNGPVGTACGEQREWRLVDPAYQDHIPWRQYDVFKFFAERNLAEQEISKEDLARYVTSTSSTFVERMNEMAIASIYLYGSQLVSEAFTTEDLALATAVAGALIGHDGATRSDPFTIIHLSLKEALENRIITAQGINPTISRYIRSFSTLTLQQAIDALDISTAQTFVAALDSSIKFLVNKCLLEAGKLNWNEIVKVKAYGRTIATGALGAAFGGFDSNNLNKWEFERDSSGAALCSVESHGSSPVKFYKIDGEACVQTHAGFVNPHNRLAPGLFDLQAQEFGKLWSLMNRSTGHGVGAYLCRNIDEGLTKDQLLAQFAKDVVATYLLEIR